MLKTWILILICTVGCEMQLIATPRLSIHQLSEIDSLQKMDKRLVLVFVYTDWCKYCHLMEHTSFKDNEVINLLNQQFWFVELNAEEQKEITFNGRVYQFKPSGNNTGIHELATKFATFNGQLSYPAICMLNPANDVIFQYNQYLPHKDLLAVLHEVLMRF